jgi:hypothetical protein
MKGKLRIDGGVRSDDTARVTEPLSSKSTTRRCKGLISRAQCLYVVKRQRESSDLITISGENFAKKGLALEKLFA